MPEQYLRLIETNAGSRLLRREEKWLILGTCVISEHPQAIKEIEGEYDTFLHVCLESIHMNMIETKLAAMVKMKNPREIGVLTVDGSPHCVQLHYIVEDLLKYFQESFEVKHFVISSKKVHQISSDSVKVSRHLWKIEKLKQTPKKE